MAQGNIIEIPVKIFDATSNTHIMQYYVVNECDTAEEQNEEIKSLIKKLAGKE